MAKSRTIYECTNCGGQFPKWSGQCGECGKWNSLVESIDSTRDKRQKTKDVRGGKLQGLGEIQAGEVTRVGTGIGELDRVLGGGLVPGEVVLMIGEPGIGKSTLLTQLAMRMGEQNPKSKILNPKPSSAKGYGRAQQILNFNDQKSKQFRNYDLEFSVSPQGGVVYVCGEESPGQVKLRVARLLDKRQKMKDESGLQLLAETDVDTILATVEKVGLSLLIIDSVQTLTTGDLTGQAGGVAQIKECTTRLIRYAKSSGVPVVLVGHVTKDGEMAGPKVLEHMVDAVLDLSGDRYHELRLLRTMKNRFGPTDEVGVFRMAETGMEEVTDPSEVFLSEREEGASGSCVCVVMEGTRPVLVEVQALVVSSELPVPRRVAQGVDVRRVQILLGVLQKHANLPAGRQGFNLGNKDVFVKVTGGLSIKEPAVDLAIALAVASSYADKPLPRMTVAVGEVGLLGEVRTVSWYEKRVKEARKLGYKQIISRDKYRLISESVGQLIGKSVAK